MSIDNNGERSTRYEGYSDYNVVSRNVANSVDNAVDAYARVQSRHSEGARVKPDLAAEGSAHILGAALRLLPEIEQDEQAYEELLEEWTGDDGYIARLKRTSLVSECPEWLGDFVVEIRRAGWQLGYLRAGRMGKEEPDDIAERDTEEMFDT